MKKILILSTAFMFGSAIAADNSMNLLNDLVGELANGGLDKIANESQNVAQCINKIDKKSIDKQQEESEKVLNEVKSICAKGDRDGAKKLYTDFYNDFQQSKLGQEMEQCFQASTFIKSKRDELMNIHPCDNNFLDLNNFKP